jgi:hypothetical protein
MPNWRKTKCCGTCAFFPLDSIKTASGAVFTTAGAKCEWKSTETYPISVVGRFGNSRPDPGWVRVLDGAACECHTPRA